MYEVSGALGAVLVFVQSVQAMRIKQECARHLWRAFFVSSHRPSVEVVPGSRVSSQRRATQLQTARKKHTSTGVGCIHLDDVCRRLKKQKYQVAFFSVVFVPLIYLGRKATVVSWNVNLFEAEKQQANVEPPVDFIVYGKNLSLVMDQRVHLCRTRLRYSIFVFCAPTLRCHRRVGRGLRRPFLLSFK